MMIKKNTIKYNAIMNGIQTMSSMLFQLITFPYASRVLLAVGTGKVSFYSSIQAYCVLFATLGISTYGIRAVATVRDDKDELTKTVKELLSLNSLVTTFVLLGLLALSSMVPRLRREPTLLLISFVFIAASPVAMNWLYTGIEQYAYITKRSVSFKVISAVLIFAFVKKPSDYPVYALILAFSTVGSDLCNLVHSRKIVSWSKRTKLDLKKHLKPTLILFASLLAINIYINLDTVMLGLIQDDRAVGIYSLAVKAKLVLLQAINAISAVLLPRLSYYANKDNQEEYNHLLRKSIVTILMIAIPVSCFFILDAENIVMLLGGKDYKEAIVCLRILMPILVISGFSNITGNQILIPLNREKYYLKAVSIGAVADVVLNVFFIKSMSYNGAAIATLIAEMTQMSIQAFHSRDYLKNNIKSKSLLLILLSTVFALIITYFTAFSHIKINSFVDFIVDAIVFFTVFGTAMLFQKEPFALGYLNELLKKT